MDAHSRPASCGIDIGTQGVRAVVVADRGTHLGEGTAPISDDHRDGLRHEQRPDAWWDALVLAVRAALTQCGDEVDITALALDATSGTVLVEAADGQPRGPALMYDDNRAGAQAVRADRVGSGLWDELGYRMQAAWALPRIMWLLENGAVGHADRLVHQSDHLVRRLTGDPVSTDTSHALKSGVDLRTAQWPLDLLADLGVSASLLPPVVLPGATLGVIGAVAAAATGLASGTVIKAGMTDGCAAQIAAAALRPGSWSSALGTTLVIKGSTPSLLRDPNGAVYCHRNPDGGWLPGGASSTGAGVLKQEFPHHDSAALEVLTAQARGSVPATGITYALVGHGERFPFVAPDARGFLAADATTDPARFAALCLSVAYVERLAYDVLGALGADVSGPVTLSGGATANAWWNQLRTDVLGRPTLLPASVQAAAGMAVLAAAPAGQLARTAERMVRITERYEPEPARGESLRPGYEDLVAELTTRGWLDSKLANRALAPAVAR